MRVPRRRARRLQRRCGKLECDEVRLLMVEGKPEDVVAEVPHVFVAIRPRSQPTQTFDHLRQERSPLKDRLSGEPNCVPWGSIDTESFMHTRSAEDAARTILCPRRSCVGLQKGEYHGQRGLEERSLQPDSWKGQAQPISGSWRCPASPALEWCSRAIRDSSIDHGSFPDRVVERGTRSGGEDCDQEVQRRDSLTVRA
jgi:hypothetical protein